MAKLHLVDNWRSSWRWASVRLAWVAGALVWFLTAYSADVQGLVAYVPEQWRPLGRVGLALVTAALPWVMRVLKRPEKADG